MTKLKTFKVSDRNVLEISGKEVTIKPSNREDINHINRFLRTKQIPIEVYNHGNGFVAVHRQTGHLYYSKLLTHKRIKI